MVFISFLQIVYTIKGSNIGHIDKLLVNYIRDRHLDIYTLVPILICIIFFMNTFIGYLSNNKMKNVFRIEMQNRIKKYKNIKMDGDLVI